MLAALEFLQFIAAGLGGVLGMYVGALASLALPRWFNVHGVEVGHGGVLPFGALVWLAVVVAGTVGATVSWRELVLVPARKRWGR